MIKLSDYFMGRGLLLHLAVIGVAALLLAAWMATASANSRKVLAAGHGNLTYDGELRTFSFSAVRLKDGTVKGEAELYNRAQNVRNHVKVDCAMIVGNVAVLSGVVTRYNDPEWADQPVIFAVRDNGEGADASADEITLVVIIPPWADCVMLGLPPDEAWLPIEAGNIQVLPQYRNGDDRKIDDPDVPDTGNGTAPIVDMGADEYLSTANRCEGDFDNDDDVDASDLELFATDFGRTDCTGDCKGDFDTDGDCDGSDLAFFAADFGRTDCH